ncbi:hypothetical protein VTI28DRAFT_8715 [Corynascus sepedonium]
MERLDFEKNQGYGFLGPASSARSSRLCIVFSGAIVLSHDSHRPANTNDPGSKTHRVVAIGIPPRLKL